MDLPNSVTSSLVGHANDTESDSFMLSVSMDDDDDHALHTSDISRTGEGAEPVLPNIEEVPYLLDTDCLLSESPNLTQQVDDVYHSLAISLHSYSQAVPIIASECLHNYSQPLSLPSVGANTEVLHNYSQPWPQSTDSYTSVHNYCIANDTTDPLKDVQPQNEVKIFKLSKPDDTIDKQNESVSLKLQLVDSFVCKWKNCDMMFASLQLLAQHTSTHIKSQTVGFYQCLWKGCTRNEAQFEDRYRLVQHMRIHTAERPHKCSLCQAEFATAEGLTKHQRVHTGEKPYTCPHAGCTKAFKNSGDRHKHVQTHKTKYPYHCKYPGCGKMYTDPGTLRKHVRVKHPDVVPPARGPTIQKRVKAATLLTNSGVETDLNVHEFTISGFNGAIHCDDAALLATAGIKPAEPTDTTELESVPLGANHRIRTLLSENTPSANNISSNNSIGLVTRTDSEEGQVANPNSWVTFNTLDDT